MADITKSLSQIEQGDASSSERLLPLICEELRKLATAFYDAVRLHAAEQELCRLLDGARDQATLHKASEALGLGQRIASLLGVLLHKGRLAATKWAMTLLNAVQHSDRILP